MLAAVPLFENAARERLTDVETRMKQDLLFAVPFAAALLFLGTQPAAAQMPRAPQPGTPSMGEPSGPRPNDPLARTEGNPDSTAMRTDDKRFVKDAALGDMTELEVDKLAQQKASSDAVRQFAKKMLDDRSRANDELKQAAEKSSIEVPDSLDSRHRDKVDKLAKLSGSEFDRAYIKEQLKDQKADVREFQREADSGADANIRNFASQALSAVQQRLEAVKELNKSNAM